LLQQIEEVAQIDLRSRGIHADLVTVEPSTFYGPWSVHQPTEVAIRRAVGAPGLVDDLATVRLEEAFPLFEVVSTLAWRDGVHGLEVNPTVEGPLWNVQNWWLRSGR
jgi:hypothetical protein